MLLGIITLATIPAEAGKPSGTVGPYYATPSWDQTLTASKRFIVLSNMNNAAILDKETGLVWEQMPSNTGVTWVGGMAYCNALTTGIAGGGGFQRYRS
jgi:hypothetical protein